MSIVSKAIQENSRVGQLPLQNPACLGLTDMFFSHLQSDISQAVKLCGICPMEKTCLKNVEGDWPKYGIWAGTYRGTYIDKFNIHSIVKRIRTAKS